MKTIRAIWMYLAVFALAVFICHYGFAAGGTGNVKQLGKQVYVWSFNEGQGKEVKDSTAGIVGKIIGDPKWTKGVSGKAGDFALELSGKAGNSQYIEVAHCKEIDIDEQLTMAAWVYPNSLPTGGQENKFTIMLKRYYLQLEPADGKASPLAYYFYQAQPEVYYLSDDKVEAKKWSHVALVWNGDEATFYINGKKSNTVKHKGPGESNPIVLKIGGEDVACCPRFFQGLLDDVTIANYALSEAELKGRIEALAVSSQGKLPAIWGALKAIH